MNNYQENATNLDANNFAPSWTLDKSKLSKMDLEVLKLVKFPEVILPHKCIGKRMAKFRSNDTWHYKNRLELGDIMYLPFAKQIAIYQFSKDVASGSSPQLLEASRSHIEKTHRSKPYKQVYIDGHYIQQELEWLLHNFSSPAPTPNMIEAKTEEIAVTHSAPKKKGKAPATLTEEEEVEVENMAENGATAKEIAQEINKPQVTVINYLKSLKNV
jgi:hypothetical protein